MGEWTLYDASGPVRSGLTQEQAENLVDVNLGEGNTEVYAMGPNGERYPEA